MSLLYFAIGIKMRDEKVQSTDHIYSKITNFSKGAAHRHIIGRGNLESLKNGTGADCYNGYDGLRFYLIQI
jgi:hypothetical protein